MCVVVLHGQRCMHADSTALSSIATRKTADAASWARPARHPTRRGDASTQKLSSAGTHQGQADSAVLLMHSIHTMHSPHNPHSHRASAALEEGV